MNTNEIHRCDCCKGKLVPEAFWIDTTEDEKNGPAPEFLQECKGTPGYTGYCQGFSLAEIKNYEESQV